MQPKRATAPMLKGTVLHSILLENKKLDDLVLVYPTDCLNARGGLIGARAEDYRNAHPNHVCLKYDEYDGVAGAVKAVLGRYDLCQVLEQATSKEQRFDAALDGLPCKCKPDIACDVGDYIALYDLKFSEKVDPDSWRCMQKSLALWMQDAHYSRVVAERFGKPVQFRFWNIEVEPPHRVIPRWYDTQSRERAFQTHRSKLLELAECYESNEWGDNWDPVSVLSPWDLAASDDEMVEVSQ
jgi:hypothetical protein